MPPHAPSRRFVFLLILVFFTLSIIFVSSFRYGHPGIPDVDRAAQDIRLAGQDHDRALRAGAEENAPLAGLELEESLLKGRVVAGKLGNETVKAELGRAAWKLFHTTFAAFPDKPTKDESAALRSYIHLFQRLYPCGECAAHFRTILDKFPPQVSSRNTAAAWGCHVHNEVNKSLGKPIFDCANIGDFYDCGCADADDETLQSGGEKSKTAQREKGGSGRDGDDKRADETTTTGTGEKLDISRERKEDVVDNNGRELNKDLLTAAGTLPEVVRGG